MKNRSTQIIYYLLIIGVFFVHTCDATAVSPYISEVYPAPNSGENEWVEITNPSNQIATISGWLLYDQLATPSLIFSIVTTELTAWETRSFDLETAKLNNSGDAVVLYNESGFEIDRLTFTTTTQGKSWNKLNQVSEPYLQLPTKNFKSVEPSVNPSPTSVYPTQIPTTTIQPIMSPTVFMHNEVDKTSITITEVMACPPSGQQEWVELFNSSFNSVNMDGWYITDAQDQPIYLSGFITAQSYKVFNWDRSLLNNQGDSISLYNDKAIKIISIDLPQCISGQSYALINNIFEYNDSPSPGIATTIQANATIYPSPASNATLSPNTLQFATESATPSLNSRSITSSFLPTIPSSTQEKINPPHQQSAVPIQIVQTPKSQVIPWLGVIISCITLLIACYYHLHVTTQSHIS